MRDKFVLQTAENCRDDDPKCTVCTLCSHHCFQLHLVLLLHLINNQFLEYNLFVISVFVFIRYCSFTHMNITVSKSKIRTKFACHWMAERKHRIKFKIKLKTKHETNTDMNTNTYQTKTEGLKHEHGTKTKEVTTKTL